MVTPSILYSARGDRFGRSSVLVDVVNVQRYVHVFASATSVLRKRSKLKELLGIEPSLMLHRVLWWDWCLGPPHVPA